ncbi:MAG: SBBP repeat-containing protein, partial [Candidatus Kariarchaeaceae archaeon]
MSKHFWKTSIFLFMCLLIVIPTFIPNNASNVIYDEASEVNLAENSSFQHPGVNQITTSDYTTNDINETNVAKMNDDYVHAVAVDSEDNIIVGGKIINNFDYDNPLEGYGYVSKLSEESELLWTYFFEVGEHVSIVTEVVVDNQDNIIVAGVTSSDNFPVTPGAFDETFNGVYDLFLAKLTPAGFLDWCTYVGGSETERWEQNRLGYTPYNIGITVDSDNNIILTSQSNSIDFPTLNPLQGKLGEVDAVICKFSSTGELIWSTFFGGNGSDFGISVATDIHDNIYLSGVTYSSDFPRITGDAYQQEYMDNGDLFLTKLDEDGGILWNTYFGEGDMNQYSDIALDSDANIYLFSMVDGSEEYPTTKDSFQPNPPGSNDLILCKFNTNGEFIWMTYVGGESGYDYAASILVDKNDNVIITGASLSVDYPTKNAEFDDHSAGMDVILSMFSSSGDLVFSTYLGGKTLDFGSDIAIDNSDNILLGGISDSSLDAIYCGGISQWPSKNRFEYKFDDCSSGFVSKWENDGTLVWSTQIAVISQPSQDNDLDTLTNYEEYQRCFNSSFKICTNPLKKDTDDDSIDDNIELDMGINPALRDTDGDGLNDGNEQIIGTLANNTDSDGDIMDDYWELMNDLDPLSNDSSDDPDHDTLTNLQEYWTNTHPWKIDSDNDSLDDYWEVQCNLNPNFDDANLDPDNDGLTNLKEYMYDTDHSLNATNPDTDGDGLPDGWEVDYGLDPLDKSDFDEDPDGDFLQSQLEYKLRKLGFRPDSSVDVIIALTIIMVFAGLITGSIVWVIKQNQSAKRLGFDSYRDQRKCFGAGFNSAVERSEAIANGFMSAQVRDTIIATGHEN